MKLLYFFMLLLCISIVAAASDVTVNPIDNEITPSEPATFELSITNHEDEVQRYSVYSLQSGLGWNVDPDPLKDKIIVLGATRSYTTTIKAQPLEEFLPGIYTVPITIESDLGEQYNRQLKVYLSPENPTGYLPALRVTVDMDDKITPKEPVSIKLFLENRNPLDIKDLHVEIQSDMAEFQQEAVIDLPPLEQKLLEFSIIPNEFQQPKDYILFIVFTLDEETVKVVDQRVEIIPLTPEFSLDVTHNKVFMKTYTHVKVTNEGNVLNTQDVKIPVSGFGALFTKGGDVQKIDGQKYLVWRVELGPNESVTLEAVKNYRWGIYVLIILILFGLFYWYVQSPIIASKKAQTTKSVEKALSEIKVTLEVKNRSRKLLKKIVVTDQVPGIANVTKDLELGTLKPTKVKHGKKSSKIIWSLAELDPGEHRIITYKIKAKLNIVGMFSLPRAHIEYKNKRGKKGKAYSNTFRLSS